MQTGLSTLTGEPTRAGIPVAASSLEDGDRPRALVAGEDPPAGRVDREVPRVLPADAHVPRRREAAGRLVDGEDGEAVVAAVRAVDEAAVGRYRDLGRRARPGEARGQGAHRLERREGALVRVVGEGSDRREELVDHVEVRPGRVERQVAGPGSGGEWRRPVGLERALRGVEAVDEDPVGPEVGREGEALGGIEVDAVSVRLLLPARVRAGALVGAHRRGGLQATVGPDGQDRHGAAAVVRDEDVSARLVHDEVAGPRPFRRLLVEEREITGLRVDREGAHRARLGALEARHLPHRVEEAAVRVEGEERGVLRLGRESGLARRAGGGVEGEAVDPAARAVGVGADVDGDGAGLGGRRGDGRGGNRGECDQEGGAGKGSKRVGHGRDPAPAGGARQRPGHPKLREGDEQPLRAHDEPDCLGQARIWSAHAPSGASSSPNLSSGQSSA